MRNDGLIIHILNIVSLTIIVIIISEFQWIWTIQLAASGDRRKGFGVQCSAGLRLTGRGV